MGNTEKQRNEIADTLTHTEAGIEMIPDGPGRWIFEVVAPEGLKIRPGDVISIDNLLLDELKTRSPDIPIPLKFDAAETVPATEPEDTGGDAAQTR